MAGATTFTWGHALQLHSDLSPFESPLPQTHKAFSGVQPVSWQRRNIAGTLITIYGLKELPSNAQDVTCLWLLHGRGDTQDSMAFCAAAFLHAWAHERQGRYGGSGGRNLICITFDQRNHGSRMVDNVANVAWKQGNRTHGMDMYNTYCGTAVDLSHLITHVPSYLPFKLRDHICGGVSLGGHATWQILVNEPRVTGGIVIVGCPDYVRLMTDRAIRSKVPSTLDTDPPGRHFLGSPDFPPTLLAAIEASDPAGVFLGELDTFTGGEHLHRPTDSEIARLRPIMESRLAGKKIFSGSGGHDRLVPYAQSEPFLTWLKTAVDRNDGWAGDLGIEVHDLLDADARHEFSATMRKQAERWLCDFLVGDSSRSETRGSKL